MVVAFHAQSPASRLPQNSKGLRYYYQLGRLNSPAQLKRHIYQSARDLAKQVLVSVKSVSIQRRFLSESNCEVKIDRRQGRIEIPLFDKKSQGVVDIVVLEGVLPNFAPYDRIFLGHWNKKIEDWRQNFGVAIASSNHALRKSAATDAKTPINQRHEPIPMFINPQVLPQSLNPSVFNIGEIVDGKYRVSGFISRGGLGGILLAKDLSSGKEVVLKVALDRNLSGEIEAFKKLNSNGAANKYFVKYLGEGTYKDNIKYMALEYICGRSLIDEINDQDNIPLLKAIEITSALSLGLMGALDAGIIHRDINPGNIMVREDTGELVIIDLGHSLLPDRTAGTPQYASPEQIRDEHLDHRTDIYSLGILLYEMLSGSRPFSLSKEGLNRIIQRKSRAESLPDLPRISDNPAVQNAAQKLINKMTADTRKRYRSYKALLRDLGKIRKLTIEPSKAEVLARIFRAASNFIGFKWMRRPKPTLVVPPPASVPFKYRVAQPLPSAVGWLREKGLSKLAEQTEEHYERSETVVYEAPTADLPNLMSRVAFPRHSEISKLRSRGLKRLAAQIDAYYEDGKTRVFALPSPAIFSLPEEFIEPKTGVFRAAADLHLDEDADTQVW
jgi:serine/threonine protein kinase